MRAEVESRHDDAYKSINKNTSLEGNVIQGLCFCASLIQETFYIFKCIIEVLILLIITKCFSHYETYSVDYEIQI